MAKDTKKSRKRPVSSWPFGLQLLLHLGIAAAIVSVVVIAVGIFLTTYTRHGEKIPVPDFFGMSVQEASRKAEALGIEIVVTDSVYNNRMEPGTIYSQIPRDSSFVKKGRHISVVINSTVPRKVVMPSLLDISLRQAMANLSFKGLQLGRLQYVSSREGTNLVLEQRYRGKKIEPGQLVESGATIDLVLGVESKDRLTYVPDVIGKRYRDAVNALHDNSLNVTARFDHGIKTYEDSLKAVVVKMRPEPSPADVVERGAPITIYLESAPVAEAPDEP